MIKSIGSCGQHTTDQENMSNLTSASGTEPSCVSSINTNDNGIPKKKRNQPGHPEPGAEVIALSPRTLLATNRFVCEVCNKGFQRDQNLQLHRRGHNLPWKLKQRSSKEVRKKVYVCPEISCVHHDPSRALGDLTGIKKHFFRKHGEKKWKCDKCSKKYAVQSDWKAHSKICGTREYRCDCGTIFSRRDSFITHRAFCDALAQENSRSNNTSTIPLQTCDAQISLQSQFNTTQNLQPFPIKKEQQSFIPPWLSCSPITAPPIDLTTTPSLIFQDFNQSQDFSQNHNQDEHQSQNPNPSYTLGPTTLFHHPPPPPHISATALLQKAASMGSKSSSSGTPQFPSPTGLFIRPHQAHVSSGHSSTAGFGCSRDEFSHSLASYGNKAAAVTGGSTDTGASVGGGNTNPHPSSSSLLHEMMMMSNGGFEGSAFDDMAFGEILNSKKDDHATHVSQFSRSSEEDNMMTRDFLGLRPLSHTDILSITGLTNCLNDNQNHNQKSWQD